MSSLTASTDNTDTLDNTAGAISESSFAIKPAAPTDFLQSVKRRGRYLIVLIPSLVSILVSGCGSFDIKRMTYDALRQQDCLVNEFDEVCTRSFALDYYDYTQVRKQYLRSISHNNTQASVDLQRTPLAAQTVARAEAGKFSSVNSLSAVSLAQQFNPAL